VVLPTLELVAIVVEVVHLRQAGLARTVVEGQLVQNRRMPRHAARRLIGQVEQELLTARRRMELPLAVSAEALLTECVELRTGQPSRN
jgi:hypothetical protein